MTMRAVGCVRAKPSLLIGVNCCIVKGRAGQGRAGEKRYYSCFSLLWS